LNKPAENGKFGDYSKKKSENENLGINHHTAIKNFDCSGNFKNRNLKN